MDAAKFIQERNRMCNSFDSCSNCPLNKDGIFCYASMEKHSQVAAEEVVQLVEGWSKENPRKTRQSVFLEQYPNAKCVDGVLVFCPKWIDTCFSCLIDDNNNVDCATCRHEFWMQEIE